MFGGNLGNYKLVTMEGCVITWSAGKFIAADVDISDARLKNEQELKIKSGAHEILREGLRGDGCSSW